MSDEPKRPEPEVTDPNEIRQSLRRLDRSTSWFWWNTIVVLGLLFAAVVVLSVPRLLGQQWDLTSVVRGLLLIMLVLNGYTLYHQRHFKQFRQRLAEQMQIAIEQRMRADKFYGLAILDPLTGLYNRRYGEERMKNEITRVERNSYDLAVLVMDLDNFKQIN